MVRYNAEQIALGERGVRIPHPKGGKRALTSSSADGSRSKLQRVQAPVTPSGQAANSGVAGGLLSPTVGTPNPGGAVGGNDPDLWEEDFSLWELFGDDEDESVPDRSMPSSMLEVDQTQEVPGFSDDVENLFEDEAGNPHKDIDDMEEEDEEEEVRALDLPARKKWA